ncbi:MAG: flagellar hook-basal body complex protein [Bdellovibrionales bacterium]
MSLFGALNVAVSGLNAQSQCIGNIADNLSNAQTTGFKCIGTTFSDLVTASSATSNSPGGVRATPSYQNDVQGNIGSTATTTNLAISGTGYFTVTTATQDATGQTIFTGSNYYSRAGDFTLNKEGYMVNSSGYFLQGYTITGSAVDTSGVSPILISSLLDNPEASTTITYVGNLPAGVTDYTSAASTVDVYDALGSTHQTSITWETTATTNVWLATVTVDAGGDIIAPDTYNYIATFEVAFNSSSPAGTIQTITGISSGYYVSTDDTHALTTDLGVPEVSTDTAGQPAIVYLGGAAGDLHFPGAGTQTINFNLGNYSVATGLTQYANSTSTVSVSSISQDGLGEGSFSSISIDKDGIVSINYTNGSVRKIYQIPLAAFNSPDNLQRGSGGVYNATIASGPANLHLAGTNGTGTIASGSLEASTVDIASEFTTMIQSQQVYSANAKMVSAVNSMLSTIIQAVQ